jgi:uncharacterized phage-like protein YoqJ
MKRACFTGHRYIHANKSNINGINHLIHIALNKGVTKFYNGMALGTDLLSAQILIQRKIPFIAVIPCPDQTELWLKHQQQLYEEIRKKAKSEIILYPKYTQGVMQGRDKWMINHSDILLSVYDGRLSGGTKLTVEMALSAHKLVINYNPIIEQITEIKPKQLTLF